MNIEKESYAGGYRLYRKGKDDPIAYVSRHDICSHAQLNGGAIPTLRLLELVLGSEIPDRGPEDLVLGTLLTPVTIDARTDGKVMFTNGDVHLSVLRADVPKLIEWLSGLDS